MTMMQCATHMPCCQILFIIIFLPFVRRYSVQPTYCVVNFFFILFFFLLLDNVVCNPYAVSLIFIFYFYFPSFCQMTWCATHTPCHQFLFILFSSFCLMMRHATHMSCHWFFYFISFIWFDDAVYNQHTVLLIFFYVCLDFIRSVLDYESIFLLLFE